MRICSRSSSVAIKWRRKRRVARPFAFVARLGSSLTINWRQRPDLDPWEKGNRNLAGLRGRRPKVA